MDQTLEDHLAVVEKALASFCRTARLREEAKSEAYLGLAIALDTYDELPSYLLWVIVQRAVVRQLNKRDWQYLTCDSMQYWVEAKEEKFSIDDLDELNALPPNEAKAVLECVVHSRPERDVAVDMECSPGQVNKLNQRGLHKLQVRMENNRVIAETKARGVYSHRKGHLSDSPEGAGKPSATGDNSPGTHAHPENGTPGENR